MTPVVIVGGGMAGLSTAYELHLRQVPFILLEGRARAGGVIISERVDKFVIDGGPDSLLAQKPEAIALCQALGLGDQLIPTTPPRQAFIQRGGRLHPLPAASVLGIPTQMGPFLRTGLFSWAGKARMGAEWFVPRRCGDGDESIGAFMTRRFGQEATTYLAEPLLAGIHAGDVNRLSVRAMFPRFTDAEARHGSLLRAFGHAARAPVSPASSDGAFRSLPGGLSDMVRALVGALPAESIRFGVSVTRVRAVADSYVVETAEGAPVSARAVVLAAPAYATASIARDLSPELSRLCDEVPYLSAGTVVLAFRRDAVRHPLNGSGFVVPRVEDTGITAASWLSSKWAHRAPAGMVLMRAFVGGAREPGAIEKSDAELVKVAMQALTPLLGISGAPLFSRIYRFERANAQHEVGHLERMATIDRTLARHPGLYVTGSGFRGVGIPDVVADGRATGRQVEQWLGASI